MNRWVFCCGLYCTHGFFAAFHFSVKCLQENAEILMVTHLIEILLRLLYHHAVLLLVNILFFFLATIALVLSTLGDRYMLNHVVRELLVKDQGSCVLDSSLCSCSLYAHTLLPLNQLNKSMALENANLFIRVPLHHCCFRLCVLLSILHYFIIDLMIEQY